MKISFVTPTYNRAHLVGRTIQSVLKLAENGLDVEVVVIDDASKDDFADAVAPFQSSTHVKIIRFPENRGQNAARNAGFIAASGEIVSLIDSDDVVIEADYQKIIEAFADEKILGVFTATQNMRTGQMMCALGASGKVFDYRGFLDGTYSGEYHMFLRKRMLPPQPFEENLGIKRSCTLLTWLNLGQVGAFVILPIVTRLYDDTGDDRMGNIDNILADAAEIDRCTSLVIERNNDLIKQASSEAYAGLIIQRSYYRLLAKGRVAAVRSLLDAPIGLRALPRLVFMWAAVFCGSDLVKYLRRLRG